MEKSWRHLDFFQHQAFIHARVPRVECPECGVKAVEVPWARPGSGFTFWFEALVMALVREMPVAAAARLVREHDTRLWRIVRHYVAVARAEADFFDVRAVGLDETASRRGHNYITLFADLERARLPYATEGRDASVLGRFRLDLMAHGGDPERIEELCMDMLPVFLQGARTHFPGAKVTFDKFHVLRLLNDGVDQIRREEQRDSPELKRTRYIWLKNRSHLRADQVEKLEALLRPSSLARKTARAYRLKVAFQEFWELPSELAETYLKRWYFWATHSRLPAMIRVARTIKKNWAGVLHWFHSRISNGMLEAMNSLLQAAKARARGYRTVANLIAMAYLVCGKLNFSLPI
jgi:transposase